VLGATTSVEIVEEQRCTTRAGKVKRAHLGARRARTATPILSRIRLTSPDFRLKEPTAASTRFHSDPVPTDGGTRMARRSDGHGRSETHAATTADDATTARPTRLLPSGVRCRPSHLTLPSMTQDNTVAILAIAVSGGVALIAAVLAPLAAHNRQKRALWAESDRQARQLAHDRLLRDLEDARTRLDEVIDMGEAALSAICEARLISNAGKQPASNDQLSQARQSLGHFGYKERRVRLRLGHDHRLISVLAEYRLAVQSLYDLTYGAITQGDAVPVDAWNVSMAQVGAAQIAVIECAQETLGARIHPQSASPPRITPTNRLH
jgi:hypothetical protein